MRTPGAGELEHSTGHLAVKRRGVEMPFPGDGEVGPLQPARQADQPGHEVEARLDPGAEGGQPAGQPAGRATSRDAGDVDPGLVPVAGGHRHEATAQLHDLRGCGALLRPEHRSGVVETGGDVARDDQLDPPQGGGRAHGLEGTEAAVRRRRAAAADHDAARAGVAGGQEELAHAGGRGAHRVVAPWPREQRTSRGTGHLHDGGQGLFAGAPVQQAPLGLHRCPERPRRRRSSGARRPGRGAVPRRRRTWGPRRPSSPRRGPRRPRRRPRRRPMPSPGTCPARQPGGAREGSYPARCRGLAVRARGFEPPPPFGDRDLNPARLPIPPRPQRPRQCG